MGVAVLNNKKLQPVFDPYDPWSSSFGLPVVTRPAEGLADIFKEGKMGCLINSQSHTELANTFESLIFNVNNCDTLSKYNYQFALDNFMAPVVSNRLINIYKILL